jgi:hypothetical protein
MEKIEGLLVAIWIIAILMMLSFLGSLIWVAVHFLSKVW